MFGSGRPVFRGPPGLLHLSYWLHRCSMAWALHPCVLARCLHPVFVARSLLRARASVNW